MKIAYLITRMDEYGGAQIHIRDLSLWMQAQGHLVAVLSGAPGVVSEALKREGVGFYAIPRLARAIRPLADARAFWEIRKILKTVRPDILSCHSSKAGILGRLAARSLGIPVIFTAHGWAFTTGVPARQARLYRWIEKIAGRFSDRIIAVSDYDRALALHANIVPPDKIVTIHNGMPDIMEPVSGVKNAAPVRLLMVARFGPQKDHETLVRALSGLRDLAWHLNLIGGGDDKAIRTLVAQTGLADRVTFYGEQDSRAVSDRMARSDIYLLISRWEGFPRSILEAMRAGLPVVASDVGGVKEAVHEGRTGNLVPPGDSNALRNALIPLITGDLLRSKTGRAGRTVFVEEFPFIRMAEETLAVYRALSAAD